MEPTNFSTLLEQMQIALGAVGNDFADIPSEPYGLSRVYQLMHPIKEELVEKPLYERGMEAVAIIKQRKNDWPAWILHERTREERHFFTWLVASILYFFGFSRGRKLKTQQLYDHLNECLEGKEKQSFWEHFEVTDVDITNCFSEEIPDSIITDLVKILNSTISKQPITEEEIRSTSAYFRAICEIPFPIQAPAIEKMRERCIQMRKKEDKLGEISIKCTRYEREQLKNLLRKLNSTLSLSDTTVDLILKLLNGFSFSAVDYSVKTLQSAQLTLLSLLKIKDPFFKEQCEEAIKKLKDAFREIKRVAKREAQKCLEEPNTPLSKPPGSSKNFRNNK